MLKDLKLTTDLLDYIYAHSQPLNSVQKEILEHNKNLGNLQRMQISEIQGHFLQLIIKISNSKKCLEIGTFTGFSSLTMALAVRYASMIPKKGNEGVAAKHRKTVMIHLLITAILACGFLVIKYFEYTSKFSHDIFPSTSTFMAIYFTLTGLHGLHILGGVIVMLYFYLPMSHQLWHDQPEHFTNRIEALGLYWHFVDLVWIFLFPILYLL